MSWRDTLNVTAPGYNITCEALFVTPIPDIAGIGVLPPPTSMVLRQVRISVYVQAFVALACYTFSSTDEFTNVIKSVSSTTFIALTITSLVFLFGAPLGQNLIGLGRLRVVLALSTITYGPGFLNVYRSVEKDQFAPLTDKVEEQKTEKDPKLKANARIANILLTPTLLLVATGICAAGILFAVCVSRLSGSKTVEAAQFCGFANVAMTRAESVGWCILSLIIPLAMPFFPVLVVKTSKTDPVLSWRRHVQAKEVTSLIGKAAYWGYTSTLCALTERYISSDPSTYVAGNDELQWSFGQILSVVLLFPIVVSISNHLGKMPSYPIPDFQPSDSRVTLYLKLLTNCETLTSGRFAYLDHGKWTNLRKFTRLSKVMFLHNEQFLWVEEAKSESEMKQRRKLLCKVRAEIRDYVELGDTKTESKNKILVCSEEDPILKSSSLKYMDSFIEALRPAVQPKRIRKAKSFPCMLSNLEIFNNSIHRRTFIDQLELEEKIWKRCLGIIRIISASRRQVARIHPCIEYKFHMLSTP